MREALAASLDADVIEDFVASVDWSGAHLKRPKIADLLGQLEAWADQYGTGELTRHEYMGHLLALLPSGDRERYFILANEAN